VLCDFWRGILKNKGKYILLYIVRPGNTNRFIGNVYKKLMSGYLLKFMIMNIMVQNTWPIMDLNHFSMVYDDNNFEKYELV